MYRFQPSIARVVVVCGVAIGFAVPLLAQELTFTANPPRVLVSKAGVSPAGIPKCSTSDPTVPTAPILYCYTPSYIWTAYNTLPLYRAGVLGQGQTIVIVDAYGSPTITDDLKTFDAAMGLPDPDFTVVCPMGCPHFNPKNAPQDEAGWSFETSLDVEWAHAIAPGAKIVLVVAPSPHGDSINNAVQYAVSHYPGSILSQSFGSAEAGFKGNNSQFMQAHQNYVAAVAQGITALASTGDLGATNGLPATPNAGYPASDPLVTAVGGTQGLPLGGLVTLSGSCTPPLTSACVPTGYGAEAVWNEAWIQAAGGGALSRFFASPGYQAGLGFNTRAIPDVSYNAAVDGGVLVAYSAQGPALAGFYVFGGTSAGAPQWAGIFALANQVRASHGKGPLGFANPAIYSLAGSAGSYAADFHDITVGNNILAGTTAGFAATAGYDLATGWGTPNIANLVADLATK
jgi:subtilase family serine protease